MIQFSVSRAPSLPRGAATVPSKVAPQPLASTATLSPPPHPTSIPILASPPPPHSHRFIFAPHKVEPSLSSLRSLLGHRWTSSPTTFAVAHGHPGACVQGTRASTRLLVDDCSSCAKSPAWIAVPYVVARPAWLVREPMRDTGGGWGGGGSVCREAFVAPLCTPPQPPAPTAAARCTGTRAIRAAQEKKRPRMHPPPRYPAPR